VIQFAYEQPRLLSAALLEARLAERQAAGDWSALELVMKDAARRLVSAGATR